MTKSAETEAPVTFEIGDRISEAYYGQMGEEFARKVRNRVHWIANNVTGSTVLDIGCSQGIGCILLGREGHKVLGVDLNPHAIAKAEAYLAEETSPVRDNVEFRCADFMRVEFYEERYATIVFGAVLEHLVRPGSFIERAWQLLEEDGQIIVTVPFGINDFPDHKQTYYLGDMLELLNPWFETVDVQYFGRWIGFVGRRRAARTESPVPDLSLDKLLELEQAFFTIERDTTDRRNEELRARQDIVSQQRDLQEQLRTQNNETTRLKTTLASRDQRIRQLQEKNSQLQTRIGQLQEKNGQLQTRVGQLQDWLDNTKQILTQRAERIGHLEQWLGKEKQAHGADKQQVVEARAALRRLKQSKSYRAGESFALAGKSLGGFVKLPVRLARLALSRSR